MPGKQRAISRRGMLAGLGAGLAAPGVIGARAQDRWPSKPVKVIVPYAPGGASDLMARPWAERLSHELGVPFVVDNRGGASGTIGVEAAARSAPDGTTFLFTPNSAIGIVPQLRKVGYDVLKDLDPVARVGDLVGGFAINLTRGIKTMAEMLDFAKKNPGKLAYGSAGLGTSTQMRLEILKLRAGVDILHVPYRGSADALNDVLSGNVDMMNEIVVLPHAKAGKLTMLAFNNPARHWDFPNVPTMTEAGLPDCDVPIWYSLWAPKGTPKEAIETLNKAIVKLAKTPEMTQRMRDISVTVPTQTPEEMRVFFEADLQANARVIKEAKISLG